MSAHLLRPATVLISATLLAIAAEPLPTATALNGVQVSSVGSVAAHVTTGDVDGDGYTDLAIGNRLYWGSANGWQSSSLTTLGTSLAIVPNLSGAGTDGKIRADLIVVDEENYAVLKHVEPNNQTRITTDNILDLREFASDQALPAVGDFSGDNKLDIAWIDKDGKLTLATNTTVTTNQVVSQVVFSQQTISIGNPQYAAVAGIDWSGAGTDELDLLLVRKTSQQTPQEVQLFSHASQGNMLSNPSLTSTINNINIFQPQITVGDINADADQDFVITSRSPSKISIGAFSTGSIFFGPTCQPMGSISAWIVPDITGDGMSDLALSSPNQSSAGGIAYGNQELSLSSLVVNRPIPFISVNGQSVPAYQFAFNPYDESSPMGLSPLAVTTRESDTPWQRRLLLVDISQSNSSTSQILLPLQPQISATELTVAGPGAQAVVDSAAQVNFNTAVGVLTNVAVTASDALAGDAFSDASALPTGVSVTQNASQNVIVRVYSGNIAPAVATSILTGLRFSPASGGNPRSISVRVLGKADPADAAAYYASAMLKTATVTSPVAPLALSGPQTGQRNAPVIVRLTGGVSPYTVSATNGATAVLGQVVSDANGTYTPIAVTPTAFGTVTVTVVDALLATTSWIITVAAPALVVTGPDTGVVGQPITLRLSGGVAAYAVSASGATAVLGQATSDQNGAFTPITVTPTAVGLISVTVTDSANGTTTFNLTASAQSLEITGPTTAEVCRNMVLLVRNGTPGYTVSVSGGVGFVGSATANGTNVFVTPTQSGTITVTVTDASGAVASHAISATALPVAVQPRPVIPTSVGGQTVFGAICPGSIVGVQSLRAAFAVTNSSRARGFTWDGPSQSYRELPAEPTAGLQSTDGVFVASRVDLGLESSGPAMPPGTALVLGAGWNFVGIGPVQLTSGAVVRTHDLLNDFTLVDLSDVAVPTTAISEAYTWDGAAYSTTRVITSGVGYFIKNVNDQNKTLLLRRKGSDSPLKTVPTNGFARDVEAPPAPPAVQAAANASTDSSCGTGSGMAAVLVGCLVFFRLRLRR